MPEAIPEIPPYYGGTRAEYIRAVARATRIPVGAIIGPSRRRKFAHVRMKAMAVLYATGQWSLSEIGASFGGRHHTTVLNAVQWASGRPPAPPPRRGIPSLPIIKGV